MKSIEANFKKRQTINPSFGDYICLMQAVRGQKFTRRTIYTAFKKLISKDDYEPSETSTLVAQLHEASNDAEECTFQDKIAS